jgi:hypothetical protein
MMKGKPWTTASLKAVGGTDGVGVTFLEETFSAATTSPMPSMANQMNSVQGRGTLELAPPFLRRFRNKRRANLRDQFLPSYAPKSQLA